MMESNDTDSKINDSLHLLFAPGDEEPSIDIILFHGLQVNVPAVGRTSEDAYKGSWTSPTKPPVCWPQQWLGPNLLKDRKKARIFSISYDSSAFQTSTTGRVDLFLISENLVNDIIFTRSDRLGGYGIGQNRPVLLVGHSLGGLVLKAFVLAAHQKKNELPQDPQSTSKYQIVSNFLSRIGGVFYYSTPHLGAALADLFKYWPGKKSAVVQILQVFSKDSARLNEQFMRWRKNTRVKAWTLFEQNETRFYGLHKLVVEEASARFDSDETRSAAADHFSICKPTSTSVGQYEWLVQFIEEILSAERN